MARFATEVKLDWTVDPSGLVAHAAHVADAASRLLDQQGIREEPFTLVDPDGLKNLRSLSSAQERLLLTDSISPIPLHKALVLLDCLSAAPDDRFLRYEQLALARSLVRYSSNLHFGPEVGVGPPRPDAPVIGPWLAGIRAMARDVAEVAPQMVIPATVHQADARQLMTVLKPQSINAVITSPPYPNEKDYTRTTRLEMVLLGFIEDKADLQRLKRGLLRSNTRNVYTGDDDDTWVEAHPEVARIAREIEARRIELGKTSGFERMYARVTKLYFGGMARHLTSLREVLKPGARLAYVVGDQASYLRIMIRTGHILATIGESLGYSVVGIDLFRTRIATATREQLREEVVLFVWPGWEETSLRFSCLN